MTLINNEMFNVSEEDFNTFKDQYILDGMYADGVCPFSVEDNKCEAYCFDNCMSCSVMYEEDI